MYIIISVMSIRVNHQIFWCVKFEDNRVIYDFFSAKDYPDGQKKAPNFRSGLNINSLMLNNYGFLTSVSVITRGADEL